jgi:pathogenesis-related protein 1
MARLALGLLMPLALAACATRAALIEATADSRAFVTLVEAHNRSRASVGARPPLAALKWSASAAETARSWASRCTFRHNPRRGDRGENLYARSGSEPETAVAAAAVRSWAREAEDYDPVRNACRKGAICGHYTQMVWRDTQTIGCALARCAAGSPFGSGTWTLVVCNYEPPGNYVGQRPY